MKVKTFLQIILLSIIISIIFSMFYPKYHFVSKEGKPFFRCNKITGTIEYIFNETREAINPERM